MILLWKEKGKTLFKKNPSYVKIRRNLREEDGHEAAVENSPQIDNARFPISFSTFSGSIQPVWANQ